MRALVIAVAVLVVAAAAGGAARSTPRPEHQFGTRVAAAPEISSNWSGYAALAADPAVPVDFTDVTATWKQPKGACTAGRVSSAAFWVGLGGYDTSSTSLEQLGTAAECDGASPTPTYYAWWELVPAPATRIPLRILPGDIVNAAVLVKGQTIVFSLKNVTRKTRFSKVVTATQPLDTSSAEWVAEAPSDCSVLRCRVVPLTNFGTVTFSNIATIGNGHAGTLGDPAWTPTAIELIANGRGDSFFGGGDVLGPGVGAVPGDVSADGRTFSVSWQQNLSPG